MSDIDYTNLSDEELANLDLSNVEVDWGDTQSTQVQEQVQEESVPADDVTDQNDENQFDPDPDPTDSTETPVEETSDPSTTLDTQNTEESTTDETSIDDETASQEPTDVSHESSKEPKQTDYQAFYEKLTKPFKANGREIQVQNADDMIALMQQGANYSKKMAQLKPNLALLRTLEQHGLNDNAKIAYLVDLYNKRPEAIAKLVKEADIDLYSFDTEQAEQYTPKTVVNEPSALEDTMTELYGNHEKFKDVVSDITSLWDDESKSIVYGNPEILRVMARQADEGIYQQIMAAIDYERMFGRLSGIPFLQAYEQIEARILNEQANHTQAQAQESFTAPRPQTNQTQSPKTNQAQKQRAATPKSGTSQVSNEFDPLKLSDEEFLKFYNQQNFH